MQGGGVFHQTEILIDGADGPLYSPLVPAPGSFKVGAFVEDLTAAADFRAVEDPEEGGLAGSGGTDDGEKLPVPQGEAHIPQDLAGAGKFFLDMQDLQHGQPPGRAVTAPWI